MKTGQRKKRKIDLLFITATISTSLVLFLIGLITFLIFSANKFSKDIREEMSMEIVLNEEIEQSDIAYIRQRLEKMPFTKECVYVSKDDALKEMTSEMGVNPTEFLQYNPFYASISLKLNAEYANHDSLNVIVPQIKAMSQVREVNYQNELIDSINNNIAKVSVSLLVLALLLALISTTLINNTIKLSIYSQRFLLYSMKLVGAKWSFIRKPFVIKNLFIGIAAAVLACLMIWGGLKFGVRYEPGLVSLFNKQMMMPVFAVVFLAGLIITWLCAIASVNRFLRMKSGDLYYA